MASNAAAESICCSLRSATTLMLANRLGRWPANKSAVS